MARYIKKNGELKPVSGAVFADTPLMTIIESFDSNPPAGYIKTDNTPYSMDDYPEFVAKLPSASVGVLTIDSVNRTFAIDLREVSLKGISNNTNGTDHLENGGLSLWQFLNDRIQKHNHNIATLATSGGHESALANNATTYIVDSTGGVNSARVGNTTEVKSVGINYFIKAKQIGVPADYASGVETMTRNCTKFPDYAHKITMPAGTTSWEATEDVYINFVQITGASAQALKIDNTAVSRLDSVTIGSSTVRVQGFSGYARKGQVIKWESLSSGTIQIYPLI